MTVDQVIERMELRLGLDGRDTPRRRIDAALLCLLRAFKDELPPLETWKQRQNFHKAFRQVDVIDRDDDGYIDMAFWHLLGGSHMFSEVIKELEKDAGIAAGVQMQSPKEEHAESMGRTKPGLSRFSTLISDWMFRAKLVRCVDGDTIDMDVDLGFHVFKRVRFRLLAVDTPERGQKDFDVATDMLRRLVARYADLDGNLLVRTQKTGKYGRWLGNLYSPDGEVCLNELMAKKWPGKY